VFSVGVAAGSSDPGAAKKLVDFLSGPAAAATIKAKGMEPDAGK